MTFPACTVMELKRRRGFATRPDRRLIRPLGNRGGLSRPARGAVTQLQQRPGAIGCVPSAPCAALPAGSDFWTPAAAVVQWRHNDRWRPPETHSQFFGCDFLCAANCFVSEQAGREALSVATREVIRRSRIGLVIMLKPWPGKAFARR